MNGVKQAEDTILEKGNVTKMKRIKNERKTIVRKEY